MQPLIKNKYLARTGNVRKSGGKEDHEVRKVLQLQIWSRWMVSDRVVPETSSMDDLSWKSLSKTIILVYVQVLQYFPWKTGRFSAQYLKFFQGTIIINICNAPTSLARRGTIREQQGRCVAKGELHGSNKRRGVEAERGRGISPVVLTFPLIPERAWLFPHCPFQPSSCHLSFYTSNYKCLEGGEHLSNHRNSVNSCSMNDWNPSNPWSVEVPIYLQLYIFFLLKLHNYHVLQANKAKPYCLFFFFLGV